MTYNQQFQEIWLSIDFKLISEKIFISQPHKQNIFRKGEAYTNHFSLQDHK